MIQLPDWGFALCIAGSLIVGGIIGFAGLLLHLGRNFYG